MKRDTYNKLGQRVQYEKEKVREALQEYLLLIKQMEQIQTNISISAKKLATYESRYLRDFRKYSEAHVQDLKESFNE